MKGLLRIYEVLMKAYGPRRWWPAKNPYEMMVGAILTQNTTWSNVEKAIANLGDKLTPQFIMEAPVEELELYIRSSGYHKQKALRLKALTEWYGRYDYQVDKARAQEGEELRQELLAVKGIGPETADSILTYALEKPYFVVDAYTRRILSRLGYELEPTYDGLRKQIEESIPRDLSLYNEFHALIVEHAKRHCQKKPVCEKCPLLSFCKV